jgi:hypothetical protein
VALLVAGDFIAGKLKSVLPHFYQHVTCATRGKITLDHLCSTHRDAYKALPLFGKSDHNFILLIHAYKQKLKQEVTVTRSIRRWSDDADATLQDCFASTDWKMFRNYSNGIESIPPQSPTSWISASTTSSPQWPYVHIPTRSHRLPFIFL